MELKIYNNWNKKSSVDEFNIRMEGTKKRTNELKYRTITLSDLNNREKIKWKMDRALRKCGYTNSSNILIIWVPVVEDRAKKVLKERMAEKFPQFGKRSTDAVLESINFRFSTAKNNSMYCRVSLNCWGMAVWWLKMFYIILISKNGRFGLSWWPSG